MITMMTYEQIKTEYLQGETTVKNYENKTISPPTIGEEYKKR